MLKTIALLLALTLTQPLFAQNYWNTDVYRLLDCIEICREYKQCVYERNNSNARDLLIEFWRTCSANPEYNLPDLLWIGGSDFCPDREGNPGLYANVDC